MKLKYFKDLKVQVKESNKKKIFFGLMTEHERKVNDNDIKAFQEYNNRRLHAIIPGFDTFNKQQDYIDKSMNLTQTDQVNIGISSKTHFNQNHSSKTLPESNYEYPSNTQISNIAILNGKDVMTRGTNQHLDESKYLPYVEKNMAIADRENHRASTINKFYGSLNMK